MGMGGEDVDLLGHNDNASRRGLDRALGEDLVARELHLIRKKEKRGGENEKDVLARLKWGVTGSCSANEGEQKGGRSKTIKKEKNKMNGP